MAGKKIGELTPLGRNLISTDELELSLVGSTGSRKITGAQIIAGSKIGIHAQVPLASGDTTSSILVGATYSTLALTTNVMRFNPFIPAQDITTSDLYIDTTIGVVGSLGRILIYSDLNGLPNTKLYESADLDLSTTGIKIATTTFNFVSGTTYWLCIHALGTATLRNTPPLSILTIRTPSAGFPYVSYTLNQSFATSPTTIISPIGSSLPPHLIFITKA
jgi:hypothetical protein